MQTETEQLLIEAKALSKAVLPYRAINHKLRLQLLQLLHQNGRMIVTDIYRAMNIEQSVASQHLAILRREGIVKTEREGKFICYSLNYQRIKQLEASAGELAKMEEQPIQKIERPKVETIKTEEILLQRRQAELLAAIKQVVERNRVQEIV